MNHVIVRAIFAAAHTTVEYITGEGAMCPVCLQILGKRNRARTVSTPGDGVRYCRCEFCGISFKAVEKVVPEFIVVKTTETVDVKPKKRQSKNRKR